jgi:hypothetical protein
VLEVHNTSAWPVVVEFPGHPDKARLSGVNERVEYVDHGCSHEVRHTQESDSFSEQIFIISEKERPAQLLSIAANPPARPIFSVQIDPNEKTLLSIFGSGDRIPGLLETGRARSDFVTQAVQSRCVWWCNGTLAGGPGFPPGRPFCKDCDWPGGALPKIDECNQCKATEPVGGHITGLYCVRQWNQVRETVNLQLGLRTHPVLLTIPGEQNSLGFRWAGSSEVRTMPWTVPVKKQLD